MDRSTRNYCTDDKSRSADRRDWRNTAGSHNPRAKLTEADVVDILSRRERDSPESLAAEYGIAATTVRKICRRRSWRSVPMPEALK